MSDRQTLQLGIDDTRARLSVLRQNIKPMSCRDNADQAESFRMAESYLGKCQDAVLPLLCEFLEAACKMGDDDDIANRIDGFRDKIEELIDDELQKARTWADEAERGEAA